MLTKNSFLNTKAVASGIESIINDSQNELFIVSPYLKMSDYYLDRIKLASQRGVYITVIYGKNELNLAKPTYDKLAKMKNMRLAYREPLHAKCYLNENTLILTSMNLHASSETHNDEMGIMVSKKREDAYDEAYKEVSRILQLSVMKYNSHEEKHIITKWSCIRCGVEIPKKLSKPYCGACWQSWMAWQNSYYAESYCHHCGEKHETSKSKPLCDSCSKLNLNS